MNERRTSIDSEAHRPVIDDDGGNDGEVDNEELTLSGFDKTGDDGIDNLFEDVSTFSLHAGDNESRLVRFEFSLMENSGTCTHRVSGEKVAFIALTEEANEFIDPLVEFSVD